MKRALSIIAALVALAGCEPELPGRGCAETAECFIGEVCVAGSCVVDGAHHTPDATPDERPLPEAGVPDEGDPDTSPPDATPDAAHPDALVDAGPDMWPGDTEAGADAEPADGDATDHGAADQDPADLGSDDLGPGDLGPVDAGRDMGAVPMMPPADPA